jgi:hypothetical protein
VINDLTRIKPEEVDDNVMACVKDLFTYHSWTPVEADAGAQIREAAEALYIAILSNIPPCPTRTRALNAVVDTRMLANAAITFQGRY